MTDLQEETFEKEGKSTFQKLKPVYISAFIDTSGISFIIPVLAYFVLSYTDRAIWVGVSFSCYSFGNIFGNFFLGYVADHYGRRLAFLISIFGSTLGFLLVGLSQGLVFLLAARGFAGFWGSSIPVAQAFIADLTNIEERPKFIGLLGASIGMAFTFPPGICAALVAILDAADFDDRDQYRVAFYVATCLCFLGLIYAYRNLEEPPKKADLTDAETSDEEANKILIMICGSKFLTDFGFCCMQSIYAVWLKDNYGWGPAAIGIILTICGIEIGLWNGLATKAIVDRIGKHGLVILGHFMLGSGLLLWPLFHQDELIYKIFHFVFFFYHVAGASCGQAGCPLLVSYYIKPSLQGRAQSALASTQSVAYIASPLLSGFLYDVGNDAGGALGHGYLPFIVAGTVCILGAYFPTYLLRQRQHLKIRSNSMRSPENSIKSKNIASSV